MHPIEQLRYVARASGADAGVLLEEAAMGLSVFGGEPAAMLTACRRLLTRQPAIGPLWDLASKLVTAPDAMGAARGAVEARRNDRTGRTLVDELPDGATVAIAGWPDLLVRSLVRRGDVRVLVLDVEGQGAAVERRLLRSDIDVEAVDPARVAGVAAVADVVLLEAGALGPECGLVDVGSVGLAAAANALGTPVWLASHAGCRVQAPYWNALVERSFGQIEPAFLSPFEQLDLSLAQAVFVAGQRHDPAMLPPLEQPLAPELLVALG